MLKKKKIVDRVNDHRHCHSLFLDFLCMQMTKEPVSWYLFSLFFLSISELLHSLHLLLQEPRKLKVQVSYVLNFCKRYMKHNTAEKYWSKRDMLECLKKIFNTRNMSRICTYVFSFLQKMLSKCCENKSKLGYVHGWLKRKTHVARTGGNTDECMYAQMHQPTKAYLISYNPPALRAMVISSLPYFSSADALHRR